MNIEIHGTGRAASALGLAMVRSDHAITTVHGRNAAARDELASLLQPTGGEPDLRMIAVSDHAIAAVALKLTSQPLVPTVHTSGATSVDALAPLAQLGVPVGSFHPLQTLPDAERGASAVPGSWIAITAEGELSQVLHGLARSIGATPFQLDDEAKPTYHAAASAASNYANASLDLADRLFAAAGVPFEAGRPLVESTVANAFESGPAAARTGPVARGDDATIEIQQAAAAEVGATTGRAFADMTSAARALVDDSEGGGAA